MKKIASIALSALACFGFVACDEFTMPNPPAQSNPDEAVFADTDLKLTSVVDGTISLPRLSEENLPVDLFNYELTNVPSGYTVQLIGEMAADEEFTAPAEFSVSFDQELGKVTSTVHAMQQAFNSSISKNLVEQPAYVRYSAIAVNGTSQVRLGGNDYYFYSGTYNILPLPQANVIEDAYYLIGSFCDWDFTKAIKLSQLNPGNVYDNPDFYTLVTITEADIADGPATWKILPQSCVDSKTWDGSFGVTDITENPAGTKGQLTATDSRDAEAGKLAINSQYMVKINMETRTYEASFAVDNLWVPGMGSSTTDFSRMMRLTTSDYIHYSGTMRLRSQFWLTGQPSLSGIVYRPDGDTEFNDKKTEFSGKVKIDPSANTRMKVPADGLWYLEVNIATLEYKGVVIPSIQIIGGYNSWGTDTAVELTPDANKTTWTVKGIEMKAGDEYKFCVAHAWTYSFGTAGDEADPYIVAQNGGNFKMAADGTYDFTLSFASYPAKLTVTPSAAE